MGKQLYVDPAAEREATEIGKQFMNSTDVVRDMSRKYGRDLSDIRIHTDDTAARQAAARRVDAYSTGKDVFFARGAFVQSDPASRGLLAHELSHSIQQGFGGGESGMQHTAPVGAEQGGLIDWFRRVFGIRRKASRQQLDALDAEDAKYARWQKEGSEHEQDIMENGPAPDAIVPEGADVEVDLTQLTQRANELGWTNRGGMAFTPSITENFFREISGVSARGRKQEDGRWTGTVSTSYRSMEDMTALLENHDEATTLRMLKPLMDLDINDFTEKYPLHRMTPDQRRVAFPQVDALLQPMIGLKQWAEKYGITTLSEANQERLNQQIERFEHLSKWAYNARVPAQVSFDQLYEMDLMTFEESMRSNGQTARMQEKFSQVAQGLGAGGCVLPLTEFKSIMGKHMTGRGEDKDQIHRLGQRLAGLSYDPDSGMVTCPLPIQDLKALANGDTGVLSRYAKQLQSMDWSDEHDRERRAAQYNATSQEFMEGFDSDASYFGKMSNMAVALDLFGGDFVKQHKEKNDLQTRMKMAKNTFAMMRGRANDMGQTEMTRFDKQYSDMKNRTWIKRLFLNRKYK